MIEPLRPVQLMLAAQRYDDLVALGLLRDPDLLRYPRLLPSRELELAAGSLVVASPSTLAEVVVRTPLPADAELPTAARLVLDVGDSAAPLATVVPALNACLLGRLQQLESLDPEDDREEEAWREAVQVALALESVIVALFIALLELRLARRRGEATSGHPGWTLDGRRVRRPAPVEAFDGVPASRPDLGGPAAVSRSPDGSARRVRMFTHSAHVSRLVDP